MCVVVCLYVGVFYCMKYGSLRIISILKQFFLSRCLFQIFPVKLRPVSHIICAVIIFFNSHQLLETKINFVYKKNFKMTLENVLYNHDTTIRIHIHAET